MISILHQSPHSGTHSHLWVFIVLAVFISVTIFPSPTYADDSPLHANSDSYQAYLGIVPSSEIKSNPGLVDQDKSLHGGAEEQAANTYHIVVAIYGRASNKRVTTATVIASVGPKRLFNRKQTVKPLEKMKTSGQITYGNYFRLEGRGKYEIETKIYEADKNGYENIKFIYAIE